MHVAADTDTVVDGLAECVAGWLVAGVPDPPELPEPELQAPSSATPPATMIAAPYLAGLVRANRTGLDKDSLIMLAMLPW